MIEKSEKAPDEHSAAKIEEAQKALVAMAEAAPAEVINLE